MLSLLTAAGGPLPDELVHTGMSRLAGRAGWHRAQAEYLEEPRAWVYPPPLRWLAWVVVRWRWWPVPSPLGWVLRGRMLADAPVGLVWAGAVLSGSPLLCGLAAFLCLGLKEGSLALLPGLVVGCWGLEGLVAVGLGVAAWAVVTTWVCGRAWILVLAKSVLEQGHGYTRGYQSGGVVRVWVDLMLVSGWVVVALAYSRTWSSAVAAALVTLAVQGLGPVQNARLSVGPDLVLRWAVAGWGLGRGWQTTGLICLVGVGIDAWVAWRLRGVRDPVTAELGTHLGRSSTAG